MRLHVIQLWKKMINRKQIVCSALATWAEVGMKGVVSIKEGCFPPCADVCACHVNDIHQGGFLIVMEIYQVDNS